MTKKCYDERAKAREMAPLFFALVDGGAHIQAEIVQAEINAAKTRNRAVSNDDLPRVAIRLDMATLNRVEAEMKAIGPLVWEQYATLPKNSSHGATREMVFFGTITVYCKITETYEYDFRSRTRRKAK